MTSDKEHAIRIQAATDRLNEVVGEAIRDGLEVETNTSPYFMATGTTINIIETRVKRHIRG